ncbi:AgrD family cyclic lactone autoinducer peptide [Pseudobacteroides cellulosolvens]|uniref:AgrD family protein n=1 Tax=Pseudobacteroides cellulosolvens ATCC 35603 = DSM 2933 TaxID=398512 RepID=A0A0L6JX32_9FIRM|nr:cyclic lactone autoinducer peptide [Pseudobacteroides cellulosolvens]KNY30002.1 AgrD family protein [Pseudobacteroides cellulosolvens ATCC 35603 = DSM 2933]
MRKKLLFMVSITVAALAMFMASISTYASIPWSAYQPKAPKSLIK